MTYNVVSGDLTGDGHEVFLVGTPKGDLFALDENSPGHLLWKKTFDYGIREAIVADVDGDGLAEIVRRAGRRQYSHPERRQQQRGYRLHIVQEALRT